MRILLTGCTGRIGGRVTPLLLSHGHRVRVLVRGAGGTGWGCGSCGSRVGVHPGLSDEMIDFMAASIREFATRRGDTPARPTSRSVRP